MANIWCELNTMQIQNQIDPDAYKCTICSNKFTSPIQLTVHCIVLHGLLPCMHCLKLFGTEHLLNEHKRQQHDQRTHNCSECCESFPNEKNLCFHMTRKHFKKQCPFCTATIFYDDFQSHMTILHKITNTAAAIGAAAAATTEHINLFENFCTIADNRKQFHCHLCHDKKCINHLEKLILHFLYFHKLSLPSILRCIFADSRLDFDQMMDGGGDSTDNKLANTNKCSICGSTYSWSIPHVFHQIYCHGSVYCANCRNCFEDNQLYDEHLENCHTEELSAIRFCDDNDCNIENVIHLKTVHNFSVNCDFSKIEYSLINMQNDCNFCGEHLSRNRALSLDNLIEHFRLMHKFNANAILRCLNKRNDEVTIADDDKCQISNKRSLEDSSFERSILVEQELDDSSIGYRMDFASNVIRYVYSSESDYDSLDTDDDDDNNEATQSSSTTLIHRCEICGNRSRSKYVHVTHMHQKHGFQLKTPEFRCNICEKYLKSAGFLKRHNQKFHHTPIGNEDNNHQKRFKCTFCEFCCNGKSKMR